jgi:hypothetical protein
MKKNRFIVYLFLERVPDVTRDIDASYRRSKTDDCVFLYRLRRCSDSRPKPRNLWIPSFDMEMGRVVGWNQVRGKGETARDGL